MMYVCLYMLINAQFHETSRFRSVRETRSFYTWFMLYSGIHYVVVATILLREDAIKPAAALINLVIF